MSMKKLPKTGIRYHNFSDLNNGGYDDGHSLLELKLIPDSLTRLRNLIQQPENKDICDYAEQGATFEDCCARIGTFLGIVLDGTYDAAPLCTMLCEAIEGRKVAGYSSNPAGASSSLVSAEIVETQGELRLEFNESAPLIESPAPGATKLIKPEELN